MRLVVALGGNALLRRGEPMTAEVQRANVRTACRALAPVALEHELVISPGNGPQVGLLALQGSAYSAEEASPLDVLGAATEGWIGYLIEQELGNLLPMDKELATILTMVEVDLDDPAFADPTKPIGPVYTAAEADRLAREKGWVVRPDGAHHRRVVASPEPKRIFELGPIRLLVEHGCVVICAGGGGIPTAYEPGRDRWLTGVEAVIDKDRASALLARELAADLLVMATDVDGVQLGWGTPDARRLDRTTPAELEQHTFATGSMGPKVEAAVAFVRRTGRRAAIGALEDLPGIIAGTAGTTVLPDPSGTVTAPA
ncbi:MAG: carbamate kinase [Actinomycetota bacterium]